MTDRKETSKNLIKHELEKIKDPKQKQIAMSIWNYENTILRSSTTNSKYYTKAYDDIIKKTLESEQQ